MANNRLTEYYDMHSHYEKNADGFVKHIKESLEKKALTPRDFSIREVAEAVLGRDVVQEFQPKSGRMQSLQRLMEADTVKYTDFSNITGQILFTEFLESYESPEFVFTNLIPSEQSDFQDMEKIPSISRIGDESEVVTEGGIFPRVGPSENYIQVGPKKKRGQICEVTKEAVFGDRTGQLLEKCRDLGWGMGVNREKRTIDALIDENGGAISAALGGHRYHWLGTSYASYQSTTPYVNLVTSNGLVNDVNIRSAWQALMDLRDPYTGEPIVFKPTHIVVATDNLWVAKSILRTFETRHDTNQSAGTASRVSLFPNPVTDNIPDLQVVTSQWLDDRAATDTDWWLGSPAKYAKRYYNWDMAQEEAPSNHYDMFNRDIVYEFKASVKDIIAVIEPRAMVENNQ